MSWKSVFVALAVAPVLVVQAAEQAKAPAAARPAAQAKARAAALARPAVQPKVEARKAPVITVAGLKFRDLNKNGVLDRYEDWRLPVDQRVADLVARMTVEEKTGLMIHSSLSGFTGPNGEVLGLPADRRPWAARAGAGPAARLRTARSKAAPTRTTSSRWAARTRRSW